METAMKLNPSPRVRLVIYISVAIANLVCGYFVEKGYIGVSEVMLVNGISAMVAGMAGLNVTPEE